MAVGAATWIVRALGLYAALGVLFALPFLLRGARRIDPAAGAGTRGFRLLILPGVIALWPLLLQRWCCGPGEPPTERGAHRCSKREPRQTGSRVEHSA